MLDKQCNLWQTSSRVSSAKWPIFRDFSLTKHRHVQ